METVIRSKRQYAANKWHSRGIELDRVISRPPQETAINAAGPTPDRRNQSKNLERRHILTSSFPPSLLRASRFSRHDRTERDREKQGEREGRCQKNLIHTRETSCPMGKLSSPKARGARLSWQPCFFRRDSGRDLGSLFFASETFLASVATRLDRQSHSYARVLANELRERF